MPATSADDPNKLVRQEAGSYRTADDRFEVRQAGLGWFVVDSASANEFGQELVRGPYHTLNAVRDALPEARRTTLKPLPRVRRPPSPKQDAPEPPPPPPSWIDELSKTDATAVRRLIRSLTREGWTDDEAEELVRADRQGRRAVVATAIVERRLDGLVDGLPKREQVGARRLVRRVAELLTAEGSDDGVLPGWALVEIGPEPKPPNRPIIVRK